LIRRLIKLANKFLQSHPCFIYIKDFFANFMNLNKLDKYAMRPRNPQPLFKRKAEYLGETQINIKRIEMVPRYDRPPWKPVNGRQFDVSFSAFGPGTSNERYSTETVRTLDGDYGKYVKIFTDGSKMGNKVGYAIVKEEHTIKIRMRRSLRLLGHPIEEKQETQKRDNN
jgi:hypothetical protein